MKVKPVIPGAVIRDPETKRLLPAEGGNVPDTSFWFRRLRAGEVVEVANIDQPSEIEAPTPTGGEPVAPLMTR